MLEDAGVADRRFALGNWSLAQRHIRGIASVGDRTFEVASGSGKQSCRSASKAICHVNSAIVLARFLSFRYRTYISYWPDGRSLAAYSLALHCAIRQDPFPAFSVEVPARPALIWEFNAGHQSQINLWFNRERPSMDFRTKILKKCGAGGRDLIYTGKIQVM